jgi:hypothetical protein
MPSINQRLHEAAMQPTSPHHSDLGLAPSCIALTATAALIAKTTLAAMSGRGDRQLAQQGLTPHPPSIGRWARSTGSFDISMHNKCLPADCDLAYYHFPSRASGHAPRRSLERPYCVTFRLCVSLRS